MSTAGRFTAMKRKGGRRTKNGYTTIHLHKQCIKGPMQVEYIGKVSKVNNTLIDVTRLYCATSNCRPTRDVVLKKEVCRRHKKWVDAKLSQGHKRS